MSVGVGPVPLAVSPLASFLPPSTFSLPPSTFPPHHHAILSLPSSNPYPSLSPFSPFSHALFQLSFAHTTSSLSQLSPLSIPCFFLFLYDLMFTFGSELCSMNFTPKKNRITRKQLLCFFLVIDEKRYMRLTSHLVGPISRHLDPVRTHPTPRTSHLAHLTTSPAL